MFKQLTDKINYHELETQILKFWDEQKIFEKSVSLREGKPRFTFFEGPPTANGRPGIHHVMSRTLKDLVCRYKTMQGFQVFRKAGWDTHGLPVEIEVEKSLGMKHKDEILSYGVAQFNDECKKSVWKYKTEWEEMTRMMGYWVDLDHPYITFHNEYIESVWWALKQYFDKGFIYKGYKIQPYCPRCETPLSSHEVSLGYKDVKDPSIYVKMKVKGEKDTYFVVWTTTPWTLISNVALAVHPNVDYVKVDHKGERLILAEARLSILGDDYQVVEKFKGSNLLGMRYEPLFIYDLLNSSILENVSSGYIVFTPKATYLGDISSRFYVPFEPDTGQILIDESELIRAYHGAQIVVLPVALFLRMPGCTYIGAIDELRSLKALMDSNELEKSVDPSMAFMAPQAYFVVPGEFVTTEDGSGIVHMAPAYGEDDYQAGKKYGLPTIHPVNKSGEFGPEVTDFAGKFVKDADAEIITNLKKRGLLLKKEQYLHSYPHCWRCSSPLLYYARDSWYIRTTAYAGSMIELNKTINWIPSEVGSGRFGNWLEENKDWALSRDRFWGTPLPIWICSECGEQKCIGSIGELEEVSGFKFQVSSQDTNRQAETPNSKPETLNSKLESRNSKLLDLHKPFVDEIIFNCAKCGGTMTRTPELIDVWFDSGAMPFAQWHYPFENKQAFEESYPGDFISEGIDQTRGWFYTLHAIGSFLFDKPAFKNVLVNDLILDKQGQKMSKSKKNTVDPFVQIRKYGADATRWYLVSNSPVWRPTLFDEEGIAEVQRKFFSTVLNTYAFFALYANVDGFKFTEALIPVSERPEIDRWILSELNSLVKNYQEWMDQYDVTRAARGVSDFAIDQLSNWYVRRNRRRFWKSELGKDKTAAYQTLYECLIALSKLMAPFAPFLAEELFRNLNHITRREEAESVHISLLPEADEKSIDRNLERKMERAIRIVGLVRAMRMKSNLKVRQPLKRIILPVANDRERVEVKQMEQVIIEEINVKKIEYVTEESGVVRKKAKPNFKTLGPKFGKAVQPIAALVREFTSKEINELEKAGRMMLDVNGADYEISKEDLEIVHEDIQGWMVESDGTITVALDTELTDELVDEGLAREFVNRVQNMRKEAGFDVTDRIKIYHRSPDRLAKALDRMAHYVQQETLATDFRPLSPGDTAPITLSKQDINGVTTEVGIEKLTAAKHN